MYKNTLLISNSLFLWHHFGCLSRGEHAHSVRCFDKRGSSSGRSHEYAFSRYPILICGDRELTIKLSKVFLELHGWILTDRVYADCPVKASPHFSCFTHDLDVVTVLCLQSDIKLEYGSLQQFSRIILKHLPTEPLASIWDAPFFLQDLSSQAVCWCALYKYVCWLVFWSLIFPIQSA